MVQSHGERRRLRVECPLCGAVRPVAPGTYNKIAQGVWPAECRPCRRTRTFKEAAESSFSHRGCRVVRAAGGRCGDYGKCPEAGHCLTVAARKGWRGFRRGKE